MDSDFLEDFSPTPEPVPGGVYEKNNASTTKMALVVSVVLVGVVVGAFLAFAVVTAFSIVLARKKRKSKLVAKHSKRAVADLQSDEMDNAAGTGPQLSNAKSISQHLEVSKTESKVFTYEELKQATNEFSPSNLLGEGGFGRVYKGIIAGSLVAVKQLLIGGMQGEREFRAEVDIIGKVHHRHLVSLVGYCVSDTNRLLVYNYVPNGTLQEALHDPEKPCLDWANRMNIALGTARGLAYLHEDCYPRIIHRDIKGSNILLDHHWEAQVSDFGLAKLADDAQSHVTTRVVGTFGYVAPEYFMSGRLTDKADVYSFGVVLLELITGKKSVDSTLVAADGEESLVEWARPRLTRALETGNVDAVADPNLHKKYDEEEMFRMVEVAATCVRTSSQKRPKMAEALRSLDVTQNVDLHQGVLAGYSNAFGSGDVRNFRQMFERDSTSQSRSDPVGDNRIDGWIPAPSSMVREHYSAIPELDSPKMVRNPHALHMVRSKLTLHRIDSMAPD